MRVRQAFVFAAALPLVAGSLLFSTGEAATATVPAPRVGYFDMDLGSGRAEQATPIVAAGATAVNITALNSSQLSGLTALMVDNGNNSSYSTNYTAHLAEVQTAVDNGMQLIIHDRYVDPAETILPGGSAFNIVRDFSDDSNINVLDDTTLITHGPGGTVNNATLDGGSSSDHGYALTGSLPTGARRILSTGTPGHVVDFCYPRGRGSVTYSSIPLDYYLGGSSPAAFRTIYAPNAAAYVAAGGCSSAPATVSLGALTGTYNGSPHPVSTSTTPAGLSVSVTYNGSSVAPTAVGSYNVVATITSPGVTATPATGTLVISRAPLTVTAPSASRPYGDANPALPPAVTGFVGAETTSVLTSAPTCSSPAVATDPVGSYPVTCSGAAAANYTVAYVAGTLTVQARNLAVQAPTLQRTYGDPNPALPPTITGYGNADDASVLTTAPTCSTTATPASHVTDYSVTCAGGQATNYAFTYTDGTLSVTPATLEVTAPSSSRNYGSTNADLTPSYSGFRNSDDPSALATAATCSTVAAPTSPVGSYEVNCAGGSATDYTLHYNSGTLTVTPATLTVTGPTGTSVYGSAIPPLNPQLDGFVNGEDATALTTIPTCVTAANHVGVYAVTCSNGSATNYTFTYIAGSQTVTPAALLVTAPSVTTTYGAVPTLAPSYSGFVNGDNPASLSSPASCSTTAGTTSPAGTYPTTCSGASSSDYTVSYQAGSLVIQYGFKGFFQPINDPAGTNASVFKKGSTVPVKFQLVDSNGAPIPTALASAVATDCRATISSAQLAGSAAVVDEAATSTPANTGNCFRYDTSGAQFIYNMATSQYTSGSIRRLTATILAADSTPVAAHSVAVGIR